MNTYPLVSTLAAIILLSLLSLLLLLDSRNLLSNIPLLRNTTPTFQALQNEHLSMIDRLSQSQFTYLDRFFLILLPSNA